MEWYQGNEWASDQKGLRKKVLDIDFQKLDKPSEIAKVLVVFKNVEHLNGRPSKYLNDDNAGHEQTLELGTALTPVDCYVDQLLQKMVVGETARCFIKTKSANEEISFIITLVRILDSRELFTLKVKEIYQLALQYKENGVQMFKKYPLFAHAYFARSAKFLVSYKPFDHLTAKNDGVDGKDLEVLLTNIQTNLAACLLLQQRYEHVLYLTKFVDTVEEPTEKSCYRRAVAFFKMKEYDSALRIVERIPHYSEKRDFIKLHASILESRRTSNDLYKNLVQRMFNN